MRHLFHTLSSRRSEPCPPGMANAWSLSIPRGIVTKRSPVAVRSTLQDKRMERPVRLVSLAQGRSHVFDGVFSLVVISTKRSAWRDLLSAFRLPPLDSKRQADLSASVTIPFGIDKLQTFAVPGGHGSDLRDDRYRQTSLKVRLSCEVLSPSRPLSSQPWLASPRPTV